MVKRQPAPLAHDTIPVSYALLLSQPFYRWTGISPVPNPVLKAARSGIRAGATFFTSSGLTLSPARRRSGSWCVG